jgi:hypothetical protein
VDHEAVKFADLAVAYVPAPPKFERPWRRGPYNGQWIQLLETLVARGDAARLRGIPRHQLKRAASNLQTFLRRHPEFAPGRKVRTLVDGDDVIVWLVPT